MGGRTGRAPPFRLHELICNIDRVRLTRRCCPRDAMVLPSDAGRPETTLAIACLAANVALIYRIKLQERAASVRRRAGGAKI